MSVNRYFLDEMPGETRGIVVSDDRIRFLYIERDSDRPEHRLGAQVAGRIARVEPGLKAAFVDLGAGEPFGFLKLPKNQKLNEGQSVLVEVTAEPREAKGPVVKLLGEGGGASGAVRHGPSVRDIMLGMAGADSLVTGLEAIEMSIQAEEEATTSRILRPEYGLDLSVERTRAIIAADIDYAPLPGRDTRKGREAVNRHGLAEVARQLGLRHWGGTVVIDLAGVGFAGDIVLNAARAAFAGFDTVSFGPLSKFGLVQLALPWGYRPVDERCRAPEARALGALRDLNRALLSDTATPFYDLVCGPEQEKFLAPLVAALGPRARLKADGQPGHYILRQG